jgi:predicted nucleic acid-binding protein
MILLDTNVVSEWMKTSPDPAVIAWLDCQRPAHLYLPAVVVAEIDTGIALLPEGRKRDQLRLAADTVMAVFEGRCLPFDCATAPFYADTLARSRRLGRPMSVEDAQIAAVARAKGLHLATRNGTDFDFLDDLSVIDPWHGA